MEKGHCPWCKSGLNVVRQNLIKLLLRVGGVVSLLGFEALDALNIVCP